MSDPTVPEDRTDATPGTPDGDMFDRADEITPGAGEESSYDADVEAGYEDDDTEG